MIDSPWLDVAARALRPIVNFAWPERCPGCGGAPEPSSLMCAACRGRIPRLAIPVCVRCLVREAADPVCSRHPGFRVWPAWIYDERAALVIEAFKFEQRTDLAAGLARELARVAPPAFAADAVTGVPLHRARRRERGYDQSALLADALAGALGVPYAPGLLERVRATSAQARLGPVGRRRNVRGAFRVRHPERWRGRRVLLVDDVVTTGATLESALGALRDAGVQAEALAVAWAQ